jgi:hypothetical protein
MKKPLCKWAIFMWVVASGYLFGAITAYIFWWQYGAYRLEALSNPSILEDLFRDIVRPALVSAPLLIAVGVLIDKVDQIMWDALSDDARLAIKSRRSL